MKFYKMNSKVNFMLISITLIGLLINIVSICYADKCIMDLPTWGNYDISIPDRHLNATFVYLGTYPNKPAAFAAANAAGFPYLKDFGRFIDPEFPELGVIYVGAFFTDYWIKIEGAYVYFSLGDVCPQASDTDNDGIPDKHDIDFFETINKYLGVDLLKKPSQCPQNFKANPINIFNSNNFEQEADFSFNSPFEGALTFKRFYNSQSPSDSTIGYGWTHNYNYKLHPDFGDSSQLMEIISNTGQGIYFDDNDEDGIFKGAFSENSSITTDQEGNYVWTRDDGTVYKFEQDTGNLLSITDKSSNIQILTYTANNLLGTVTDLTTGRTLTFHYTASNKIEYITGPITLAVPDGIWASYTYDMNNNLTGVQYADNDNGSSASGFEYIYADPNDVNNLTQKKDLAGTLLSTWIYNGNDQAIENVNTIGTGAVINYDNSNDVSVTDAYGITSIYHIEEIAGLKKITQTTKPNGCTSCSSGIYKTEYDESTGVPTKREYFNGRIDLFQDYDENDNPQTIIIAQGSDEEKTVYKTYHPDLSVPLAITEKSVFSDATNPDRNKIIIYDYDDDGNSIPNENPTSLIYNLIEKGYTLNTSEEIAAYEHITTMTYNDKGQILSIDGPAAGSEDIMQYTYDALTGDLLSISNPITGTSTFEHDAAGNIVRAVDINNIETTMTYDGRNRLLNATTDGKTSSQTYTEAGLIKDITDRALRTLNYTYNNNGLLDKITNPAQDYFSFSYDDKSNLTDKSIYTNQHTKTLYNGYDYGDPANNTDLIPGKPCKTIVRNQDNTADLATVFQYSRGNVSQTIDPAGGQSDYLYDTLNRMTQTTQVLSDTQNAVTTYSYDTQNNLTSVIDANNNQTQYTYNDNGRLVRQISPDTGTTLFTYDAPGNLLTRKNHDSRITQYTYDALNRLTSIQYDDNTQDVIYLYDQTINGKGRVTGISDATGSYAIDYDALGNQIKIDKTIDGTVFTTSYSYDGAGNIIDITYPDSRIVTYEYDTTGNITQITTTKNGTTQIIADVITYLPFGPVKTMEFGNSELQTKTFDLQYRPSSVNFPNKLELTYGYDPAGNIIAITDSLDAANNKTFTYDKAYRLINATGSSGSFNYTYDQVGNRLTRTDDGSSQTYNYISGTNKLSDITGSDPVSFTYDDNGNIITKNDFAYTYSQNNRLMEVDQNSTIVGTYKYNHKGQRTQKSATAIQTLYHYDLNGNLIAESDPQGNVLKSYIYLGSQRIAAIENSQDQNFTVRVITDEGRTLEGIKVYVFNANNAYAGIYTTTNQDGQALFEKSLLIAETYKFRADYLNDQFWSSVVPASSGSTIIEIEETRQSVTVIQNNTPKEGVRVYLFDENNNYLGLYAETDSTGTVFFDLPAGHQYKFRADIMGSQFFSDIITIASESQEIIVDSQGGTINFTLTREDIIPLANIRTYLFSATGQYLGESQNTDSTGVSSFDVPNGTYKIRCDYLGYQFWSQDIEVTADTLLSLAIPHQDIIITVNKTFEATSQPAENIKAYLFTESGSYQGIYKTTDSQGQATFNLPDKAYKIRADYLNNQYWSEPFISANKTITITQGKAALTITNQGNPLPDVRVSVFNTTGSYLGINDTTDANGNVSFILPTGSYKFRADWMNNQYWSSDTQINVNETIPVTLSTGGGTYTLTLKKDADTILEGVKCYPFSSTGSYLGQNQITDSSGQISFNLGDGRYKIRADYMGYQFWSSEFTVPDELTQELVIAHEQVSIVVNRDYDSDFVLCLGVRAYLFTESGSYQGIYKTTDTNGMVTFDLPQKAYKVRADYMSEQYWSDIFISTDQTITIEEGQAVVEVKQGSTLLENVKVYVFNDQDQYQGIHETTDINGQVTYRLPQGTWKFRADYLNSQYWATQSITAHVSTPVTIDTGGTAFTLTVEKETGSSIEGIKIYAFSSTGSYLGLNELTDGSGQVSFDLPEGDYKFRADYLGYQSWTEILNIPGASSSVLTISHQDVMITVNSQYQSTDPIQGVKVYLFTESGAYQSINSTTDATGVVTFNVPQTAYKVRVDYLSQQYWSDSFIQTDTTITIDHAKALLHVTMAGSGISGARVYLFTETGSYLSRFDNIDENGFAEFTLPANTYKFRVDHNSTEYWSDPVTLAALQENPIALNLDLLSLNLTGNPNYARYDGIAPEKEKILLASNDLEVPEGNGDNSGHTIYYFINDHLGTPLKIMDSAGDIVWSADYSPFGQVQANDNIIVNRFRFPGQHYDAETGLLYNYHRYYDPETGRYLTPDPIGLAGGINPFLYANNNPIFFIDPEGLAYFAYRPLSGPLGLLGVMGNQADKKNNTVIGHEQLFFEDGKPISNIGFFDNGTLQQEPDLSKYRHPHDAGYDDNIIREAVKNVRLKRYQLLPEFGTRYQFNCQDWAEKVRKEYQRLLKEKQKGNKCP